MRIFTFNIFFPLRGCIEGHIKTYLKLFGEDSCVLIHFITFTKCFKIVDGKAS